MFNQVIVIALAIISILCCGALADMGQFGIAASFGFIGCLFVFVAFMNYLDSGGQDSNRGDRYKYRDR